MIILVDMDDVVADTSEYLYKNLRVNHPEILEFQRNRTHYNINDEYNQQNLKIVQSVLYSKEFQSSIPMVQGSLDAITEICERGHDVKFCSTPHQVYETCVLQKYQWLEKNFDRHLSRKLILTDDKTLIRGDLLIDDKPEIKGLIVPTWEQVVFTANYNSYVNGRRRLENWYDWKKVLTEL